MKKKLLSLVVGVTLCLSTNCAIVSAAEETNNSNITSTENLKTLEKVCLAKVTADGVRIRATPNGTILGQAYKGDLFIIKGSITGWYKIDYHNRIAYISSLYVIPYITYGLCSD